MEEGAKGQAFDRPHIRDFEVDFHINFFIARGFSGFELDNEYSCHKCLIDPLEETHKSARHKKYIEPYAYLTMQHPKPLGKPLYFNQSKNFLMITGRGQGKDLEENTKVYLKDKTISIKDVLIGDYILDHNNKYSKVLNKFKFTNQTQYLLTTKDNRTVECGIGHLWKYYIYNNQYRVGTTQEIINHLENNIKIFLPLANINHTPKTRYNNDSKQLIDAIFTTNKDIYSKDLLYLKEIQLLCHASGYSAKISSKRGSYRLYCSKKLKRIQITSIAQTTTKPSYCLEIDNEDSLFVVNDYVVTHNSYTVGHAIWHEWAFDGKTDLQQKGMKASIVVGASHALYSTGLLGKVRNTIDKLPGSYTDDIIAYPAPFYKKYQGSWIPSRSIIQKYKKRTKNQWVDAGSQSEIKHVA